MREFLVVYDYGQGGVWAYVAAESASDITAAFPELSVVHARPDWLTPEDNAQLEHLTLAEPSGPLVDLLEQRERSD